MNPEAVNFTDLIGKLKTYNVTDKEMKGFESLNLFVSTLLNELNTTNTINKDDRPLVSIKSIALIKEISTVVNSLKKTLESKILDDSNFSDEKLVDLGKHLKKTYKKSLDLDNFIKDYNANITEIPQDLMDRYSKVVIRATRAPLEGEETTKKIISIIDDLKEIAPKTKLNKVDSLREQNLVESKTATLSYTKIK